MGIQGKRVNEKKYTEKNKKKLKKIVDMVKIIWYINEATCKKKQVK